MRLSIGITCLAIVLAGAVALTSAPTAAAAGGRSCGGGGSYSAPGVGDVQFGSTAREHADGKVTGQGQSRIASLDYEAHYKVLDLVFDGTTCWILGEVTKGDAGLLTGIGPFPISDLAGRRFVQSIQDNGEGAAAPADKVGGSPWWLGTNTSRQSIDQAYVDSLPGFVAPFSPLTRGNIQVQ
jgi:hypothetical protein